MRRISFLLQTIGILWISLLTAAPIVGCEQNDLGRYCVTGQVIDRGG